MRKGKQFSFWHILPKSKTELQTLIPRKLLQNKNFLNEYSVKINFSILMLIIHELSNISVSYDTPAVELKRSYLRNFIGKKIHSKKANELDLLIDSFLDKLLTNKFKTLYFKEVGNKIIFSFYSSFYKMYQKGNTVSFNLYELTSLRGENAKLLFLNVLSFDMRKENRFSKFSNLINYMDLSFNSRKPSLLKIKRAFKSLSKKGLIIFNQYVGISNSSKLNYTFDYKLNSLLQK